MVRGPAPSVSCGSVCRTQQMRGLTALWKALVVFILSSVRLLGTPGVWAEVWRSGRSCWSSHLSCWQQRPCGRAAVSVARAWTRQMCGQLQGRHHPTWEHTPTALNPSILVPSATQLLRAWDRVASLSAPNPAAASTEVGKERALDQGGTIWARTPHTAPRAAPMDQPHHPGGSQHTPAVQGPWCPVRCTSCVWVGLVGDSADGPRTLLVEFRAALAPSGKPGFPPVPSGAVTPRRADFLVGYSAFQRGWLH